MKEKKFVAQRLSQNYHPNLSPIKLYFKALMWTLGLNKVKKHKNYSEVLPWLLLGSKEATENPRDLIQNGVTHVLNVTKEVKLIDPSQFVVKQVPIRDKSDEPIEVFFDEFISFIDRVEKCKGKILVHCTAGVSRAPSAVIVYLMAKKNFHLVDALNYLQMIRPRVRHNSVSFFLKFFLLKIIICTIKY